jgi:predicted N-acetyltransferase YhbS
MSGSAPTIRPLGERRDLIDVTCEWHVPEFDPGGNFNFWRAARTREATFGGVPCAWIAFIDDQPVGSVSLIECNMDTHPELTPWLAALFVLPEYRRRRIGEALVRRCEAEAKAAGCERMYLFASEARLYYPRLGWAPLAEEFYEGEPVVIMSRDLARAATNDPLHNGR